MSKRRKGYPSETNVKRGLRTLRGGEKELVEKLGRRDPCPCGSGKRFAKCCMTSGRFRWRGAGGLLAVRSANISICVDDHVAAELDEIGVGEIVLGIVRAPGTNDEVVGAVFKQNVIDGGERGEAGLVDRAIGARLFVRIGADLLPREFFPGVKVVTVRGADGVMDQAAIIGAGDEMAFALSIAPNMRGGFAMKPADVLNLANAAIQKFGNSEFAQCNRAVVSGRSAPGRDLAGAVLELPRRIGENRPEPPPPRGAGQIEMRGERGVGGEHTGISIQTSSSVNSAKASQS